MAGDPDSEPVCVSGVGAGPAVEVGEGREAFGLGEDGEVQREAVAAGASSAVGGSGVGAAGVGRNS